MKAFFTFLAHILFYKYDQAEKRRDRIVFLIADRGDAIRFLCMYPWDADARRKKDRAEAELRKLGVL